jgi:putative ABC transport system ATP-binding protein
MRQSTLLNLLGGLDTPDSGEIWIGISRSTMRGRRIDPHRRHDLGIVFQFFNLLPAMTVAENIELPLLLRGERPQAHEWRQPELSTRHVKPLSHQLSGGEMQRAAIARPWLANPKSSADEPTGNLDSGSAERVTETLLKIASKNRHACYCHT